jgi:hypothetical protein
MKRLFVLIMAVLLSGCGSANANHETLTIGDESIWNQYHVNMAIFDERFVEELTDKNPFLKMKSSLSINSRSTFHGSFMHFEITQNSRPYEFIMSPKHSIDDFTLEIEDLSFTVTISPITSSSEKSFPWIYITGVQDKLNYFIQLSPGDDNDLIQNKYNSKDGFKPEDRQRITELILSIFTQDSTKN